MLSDEWLQRYRLLENFNKVERNGNAYDRGDYNSSFALRAVELKSRFSHDAAHDRNHYMYQRRKRTFYGKDVTAT